MTQRVAILLFGDFDLIDAGGPYEVFLTASRLEQREGREGPFEVLLASPGGEDVTAFGGMTLTALHDAAHLPPCDVVLVPGTIDVGCALADRGLIDAIERLAASTPLMASVCTGSFLLARADLLTDVEATTHWEDLDDLAATGEVGRVARGVRWVDAGSVLTSGGLTSGIHLALHLVSRLASRELALRTARQLDMDWSADPAR